MSKTILITGSSDGIGFLTAKKFLSMGHDVILHGRNEAKVKQAKQALYNETGREAIASYVYDMSHLDAVMDFADALKNDFPKIDVLINNAGVFRILGNAIVDGLDSRFTVNAIAPYLLTKELLSLLPSQGRVVNLSSAAQERVNLEAFYGRRKLDDGSAYAQSKLALTMWTHLMAVALKEKELVFVAVNPKSFLGTNMVKLSYGREGYDVNIGADILVQASLSDAFAQASGKYFDNDTGRFAEPHPDALDLQMSMELVRAMDTIIEHRLQISSEAKQ